MTLWQRFRECVGDDWLVLRESFMAWSYILSAGYFFKDWFRRRYKW